MIGPGTRAAAKPIARATWGAMSRMPTFGASAWLGTATVQPRRTAPSLKWDQ